MLANCCGVSVGGANAVRCPQELAWWKKAILKGQLTNRPPELKKERRGSADVPMVEALWQGQALGGGR